MRKLLLVLVLAGIFTTMLIANSGKTVSASPYLGDIIVQTIPGPTVAEKLTARTKTSWPWYLARGSGLIAAITLTILLLSGIGLVTGYTFRFLEPLTAWASHRALGIAFGISVLVHIISLLFDKFVPFNILQVLVPWLSHYKPAVVFGIHLGSLWVALGVLAFYATILIIISSLLWVDKKPYTWKFIHLTSYAVLVAVYLHGLYIGTDLMHGVTRLVWLVAGILLGIAILHRLWRAKTA